MEISQESLDRIQRISTAEMKGRAQIILLENKIRDVTIRLKRNPGPFRPSLRHRKRVLENVRNMYKKYVTKKTIQATKLVIQNFTESMMAARSRLDSETSDTSENSNDSIISVDESSNSSTGT